jgi:hypothetical protein
MPALVAARCDPYAKAFFKVFWLAAKPAYRRSLQLREGCFTPYTVFLEAS